VRRQRVAGHDPGVAAVDLLAANLTGIDLGRDVDLHLFAGISPVRLRHDLLFHHSSSSAHGPLRFLRITRLVSRARCWMAGTSGLDRKSTRLNSSHVKSSY